MYIIRDTARIQAQDCLIPDSALHHHSKLSPSFQGNQLILSPGSSGSLIYFLSFFFFLFLLIFLRSFNLLQLPFSPFSSFFSLSHSGIIPLSWFLPSQISPYREPSKTIPRRNKWGIHSSFSPPGQDLDAYTLSPDSSREPELIFQTARSRTIPHPHTPGRAPRLRDNQHTCSMAAPAASGSEQVRTSAPSTLAHLLASGPTPSAGKEEGLL